MKDLKDLESVASSNPKRTRHFTFEGAYDEGALFDGYHPELGWRDPICSKWVVLLGDHGLFICRQLTPIGERMEFDSFFISDLNFVEMYKNFKDIKEYLVTKMKAPEPVLCWLHGLIHALMSENPNQVNCSVVMTGTSK
jgi:hypothetical protein